MNAVKSILLYLLIMVIGMQTSSLFLIDGVYEALSMVSAVLLVLLLITCFSSAIFISYLKETRIFIFLFLLQAIILMALYGIGSRSVFPHLRDLFLCWLFVYIGYSLGKQNFNLRGILKTHYTIAAIAALSIIIFVAKGINITEIYYPLPKNQFGPYFTTAVLLALYTVVPTTNNPKRHGSWLPLLCVVAIALVLLVLRTRTAMVAMGVVLLIFVFHYTKSIRNKFKYAFVGIVAIILNVDTIADSFFLNYDKSDSDSITAGRTQVYKEALSIINEHPLTGRLLTDIEITTNTQSEIIHNYILFLYFEIGIFALGFLLIYFRMFWRTINGVRTDKKVSSLLVLSLFIISLSEYTFPFSPGGTVMLPFLLLGYEKVKRIIT